MRVFITLLLVFIQKVLSKTICDSVCVCRYEKNQRYFLGEVVNCSYETGLFSKNYTLPTLASELDMSWMNATIVPETALLKSKTLIKLFLNNNELTEIATNALQLPALRELDLSFNKLDNITGDIFKELWNLVLLNLANNRISSFSYMAFHKLSNLNEIILNNNDIGTILEQNNLFDRNGFGLSNKIESVHLSGVGMNKVPDNFFVDAFNIRQLVISDNNLTEIFDVPYTVDYLDLSDNPITGIYSEDFLDLPALKVLKLNNLLISEVPEFVFMELRGLKTLELERNKNLTEFSTFAFGREVLDDPDDFALEVLSLKGSRLTSLDEKLKEPFGMLLKLDLQGNPWNCDCYLIWLKQLQIKPDDYDHLRCATPKPLFNARVFELKEKYFVCPSTRQVTGVAIAVITFCVTLTVIALWIYYFIPRNTSRCNFIQVLYHPSTVYNVLPTAPS